MNVFEENEEDVLQRNIDGKLERETTINFNDYESCAYVWTAQKTIMTKLDKLVDGDNWILIKDYGYAKEYKCKFKDLISFRAKKVERVLTDEQKEECAKRLQEGRNKK